MAKDQEVRVTLTNTQLSKLKSAARNKPGKLLRLSKKNFQDQELPRELFLTTRQTAKIRNAFVNNMSIDIKPSKARISKKIQSDASFNSWLANSGKNH